MSYVKQDPGNQPSVEPVSLAEMKEHLRLVGTSLDATVGLLIHAAREVAEGWMGRSFVKKGYIQTLDAFPAYTQAAQSQAAYPPSYYSLPRYGTAWLNYSQMIKLFYGPLVSVESIRYLGTDGAWHTLTGTDISVYNTGLSTGFVFDSVSLPPRIFPVPGSYWPAALYAPNSVEIHYTSGYSDDASEVPGADKMLIRLLAAAWFEHPESERSSNVNDAPMGVQSIVWAGRVVNEAPTRG